MATNRSSFKKNFLVILVMIFFVGVGIWMGMNLNKETKTTNTEASEINSNADNTCKQMDTTVSNPSKSKAYCFKRVWAMAEACTKPGYRLDMDIKCGVTSSRCCMPVSMLIGSTDQICKNADDSQDFCNYNPTDTCPSDFTIDKKTICDEAKAVGITNNYYCCRKKISPTPVSSSTSSQSFTLYAKRKLYSNSSCTTLYTDSKYPRDNDGYDKNYTFSFEGSSINTCLKALNIKTYTYTKDIYTDKECKSVSTGNVSVYAKYECSIKSN